MNMLRWLKWPTRPTPTSRIAVNHVVQSETAERMGRELLGKPEVSRHRLSTADGHEWIATKAQKDEAIYARAARTAIDDGDLFDAGEYQKLAAEAHRHAEQHLFYVIWMNSVQRYLEAHPESDAFVIDSAVTLNG